MWKHYLQQVSYKHVFRIKAVNSLNQSLRSLATVPKTHQWERPNGFETGIELYHPIKKDKVPLILLHDKLIKWYACGPTVYDSAHIGHASSYVRQDVIRRILKNHFGIDSVLLMGITDVDDKIIYRSHETGQPLQQITSFYEKEFFSDLAKLNVVSPSLLIRVTEHIPQIINFIQGIIRKGFAYVASDESVYFDLEKYGQTGQYGVFSNRELTPTENSVKKYSQDFALWKASKPGEPFWDSPWGKGRPGWHIECSTMASYVFGSNFDLHSGGEDLVFPHHECEVIQSCVYHDTNQWANYWIHTGHLHISGQQDKMSKSLKNVISVSELLDCYTANQFRMLCLLTSYRRPIEFSKERMAKAVTILKMFQNTINRCGLYADGKIYGGFISESEVYQNLDETKKAVIKAFSDDFNTPRALSRIIKFLKYINQLLMESSFDKPEGSHVRSLAAITCAGNFLHNFLEELGIVITGTTKDSNSPHGELQFHKLMDITVASRDKIRKVAKSENTFLESAVELEIPKEKASKLMKKWTSPLWAVCDEMRDQVLEKTNVQINDEINKSTWTVLERVTKQDHESLIPKGRGNS